MIYFNKMGNFTSLTQTLVDIIRGLPETNIASLVFALVSGVVLIVVKELSARYRHKLPFPIPVEIVVVSSLCHFVISLCELGLYVAARHSL